jgi:hypothetical protein
MAPAHHRPEMEPDAGQARERGWGGCCHFRLTKERSPRPGMQVRTVFAQRVSMYGTKRAVRAFRCARKQGGMEYRQYLTRFTHSCSDREVRVRLSS